MDTQQSNQITGASDNATELVSMGKALRAAREQMGLSVNDVANRIKFAPRQIESLEADDYAKLPEAAFVRGFVRSYARLLELDSTKLLASLPSSHAKTSSTLAMKSVEIPMPTELSARRYNIVLLVVGLVIALSVAIFERLHDRVPEVTAPVVSTKVQAIDLPSVAAESTADQAAEQLQSPVAASQVAAPAVVATLSPQPTSQPAVRTAVVPQPVVQSAVRAAPAPEKVAKSVPVAKPVAAVVEQAKVGVEISASEHSLRMEFDEDSWVEVKDGSNQVLTSRMHTAGSLVRVTGKSPLLVTIGNARAVRLFDNGKKVSLERYTTADVAHVTLK